MARNMGYGLTPYPICRKQIGWYRPLTYMYTTPFSQEVSCVGVPQKCHTRGPEEGLRRSTVALPLLFCQLEILLLSSLAYSLYLSLSLTPSLWAETGNTIQCSHQAEL